MYQAFRRVAALIILAFCFAGYVLAGEQQTGGSNLGPNKGDEVSASHPGRSVAEFLAPDGSFDVGATNVADYEGPIDLQGFAMVADEVTGAPKFAPSIMANSTRSTEDDNWSTLGTGMGGPVYALAVYNNQLIAGGAFDTAGGISANRIASWNGASWSALATGMNGDVRALVVYNGNLIAGGEFTQAGGNSAKRIASWNGSSWSAMAGGFNSAVFALAVVYGDYLYAGGTFDSAYTGSRIVNHIAEWNGSQWLPLIQGGVIGTDTTVFALAADGSSLYAGGQFTHASGYARNCIARWDSGTWADLDNGMNNIVYAISIYNGNVIAGGSFTTAGGDSASCIASWNGYTWSALGTGLNNTVYSLCSYFTNHLYAGGSFSTAGGIAASKIASWDGSSWKALGSGVNSTVWASATYGNHLIAGGYLTTAGGKSASHIAQWTNSPDITNCPSTLTTPHHLDFSYDFNASDQENEPISWEIVSGPGSINSSGIWTWNPPCDSVGKTMSLVVCAKDSVHTCPTGKECTVGLTVQNSAPDIGGDCGKTKTIGSNSATASFTATDPDSTSDTKSWSITGVSPTPVYGSYSINSSGVLSFDPSSTDTTDQDFVFGARVTDCAGAYDGCNATFKVCAWYPCLRGDVNASGTVNALDITYLINYLYKSGPAPNCGYKDTVACPTDCGNVNNDGGELTNALDITFLINYVYKGEQSPDCPGM